MVSLLTLGFLAATYSDYDDYEEDCCKLFFLRERTGICFAILVLLFWFN